MQNTRCYVCGKDRKKISSFQHITGVQPSGKVESYMRNVCGRCHTNRQNILNAFKCEDIQKLVAQHYGKAQYLLQSVCKNDSTAEEARSVSMYLCRELVPSRSHRQISRLHGGDTPNPSQHAYKKVSQRLASGGYVSVKVAVKEIKENAPHWLHNSCE